MSTNEREQRKNELLNELSERFKLNAEAMKNIAGRIEQAAAKSRQLDHNLKNLDQHLAQCITGKRDQFSYLEYLEFLHADEFAKFRDLPAISAEMIASVDFDQLCAELQGYKEP